LDECCVGGHYFNANYCSSRVGSTPNKIPVSE
jgi:hypothetical protein